MAKIKKVGHVVLGVRDTRASERERFDPPHLT